MFWKKTGHAAEYGLLSEKRQSGGNDFDHLLQGFGRAALGHTMEICGVWKNEGHSSIGSVFLENRPRKRRDNDIECLMSWLRKRAALGHTRKRRGVLENPGHAAEHRSFLEKRQGGDETTTSTICSKVSGESRAPVIPAHDSVFWTKAGHAAENW